MVEEKPASGSLGRGQRTHGAELEGQSRRRSLARRREDDEEIMDLESVAQDVAGGGRSGHRSAADVCPTRFEYDNIFQHLAGY
jgi:hypothetical protein